MGLSDIVIFPGMVAPLLVETAQSTKLIDDVVGGDRLLGVVLQRNAEAENPLPHEMHEVGCAARVLKMLKFPDNTVRVLVEGLWRIQIKEYPTTEPYLCAKFELVKDLKEDSVELTAMMRNAQSQFQEIIKLSPALSEQIKIAALNTEDPGHFADLIAVNLNLSLEERQKLLETNSVKERLTRLLPMLNREHEVLTLSSKIQTEVATSISKTQRDFFLREQMRAIQRELGESDPNASEIRMLREKIEQTPLPPEAKQVATQELERLQQMPPAAAEYGVSRHYLDWILSLPWMKETEDKIDLAEAERILNEQHFGLTKVKDRLLEFLAVIKRRKQIKGPILCLVGPPGRGQDLPGPERGRRAGAEVCPHLAGRHAGRSGDSGTSPHLRGGAARAHHPDPAARREPQPGDHAGRAGQGGRGFPGRPGGGVAGSAGPGAEQHVHRSLPGFAVRPFARAVPDDGQLAGAGASGAAGPAGGDRAAELHGVREAADRQALPGAAPVGGARPGQEGSEDPGRHLAAGDPRLHPRSRGAAVGAGDCGADAQGDAPHREQRATAASRWSWRPNR